MHSSAYIYIHKHTGGHAHTHGDTHLCAVSVGVKQAPVDGVLQQLLVVVGGGVSVGVSAAPALVVVSRNIENWGAHLERSGTCKKEKAKTVCWFGSLKHTLYLSPGKNCWGTNIRA